MPKATFNKDKLHYVGIPETLWNKVQTKASEDRLYVTQFVHKVLVTAIDGETKDIEEEAGF